ncbi:hypothetical protein PanWU01x14_015210 [Parasponia andersonii]|uniref:Uncharacterized protein n=1 Tax=Parasponia andersonii TaxID=3476 RepID=A0A2P5E0F1_PARAD|nr:hypothetical protein PanWU01x14_015210 [Parasponia andersonii]
MAKSHPNTALLLFFFTFLLLLQSPSSSSSAARLLIGNPAENLAAAADNEPALLNLVLPGVVDVVISDLQAVSTSPEKDSPAVSGERYLPCGSGNSRRQVGVTEFQALRLCGKRGQLLMSMLPKGGGVPPSAPSRRTNGNNN